MESLWRVYSFEGEFSSEFSKILVPSKDKEKLSNFMKKDQKVFEGFEVYAIQDAIITLKHSIAMEEFKFNIKNLELRSLFLLWVETLYF